MKIKTIGVKYPQVRLVMNKVPNVEYTWVQNYINPFLKKAKLYEVYKPLGDFGVDGYHTVYTIMLTEKPWCCSFEDYVPRGMIKEFWDLAYWGVDIGRNKRIDRLMKILAKDNCKRLIALSEHNLHMQQLFYDRYGHAEITDIIRKKTIMLKVPQSCMVDAPQNEVSEDTPVKFVFVGNDFSRKGGVELIMALKEIRKVRKDFELYLITIINNKQWDEAIYYDNLSLLEYVKSQDWIHYYSKLKNSEVMDIIKQCHVGLLPTWFDTYGYSVLEMQACGVPVISTNVRAMSEINKYGWIIEMPINFNKEIKPVEYKYRELLIGELYNIFMSILSNKKVIQEKSISCLNYIRCHHSPEEYSKQLKQIYSEFSK